jgi:hypothetical protein
MRYSRQAAVRRSRPLKTPTDQVVQRDNLSDPARLGAAAMALRTPTLLVRGDQSDVLSVDDARRIRSRLDLFTSDA